jgi:hypothetical protein
MSIENIVSAHCNFFVYLPSPNLLNVEKSFRKHLLFVDIFRTTEENSRIRSQTRIRNPVALIRSGSVSKRHGKSVLLFEKGVLEIFRLLCWFVLFLLFSFLLNSQFFQVAERIGREGKRLHFDVQVSAFDDFLVGEYVTSTVPTGFG